ncbi:LysR family transcriptional regulator [Arthrobacter sp. ISL-95]|uniref:LysR family transcriptional regulator n=1 Tax=Arthrobacter sp. ISL-95 TaxID=2819116 RepID=UPI001BEB4C92|nr:LysR family transcriptional regulator [Arthrobacter sp. ISL-95]MBT2588394.1 LysR family transcriptional regulator [Arthrobacter sp. ISL-95]
MGITLKQLAVLSAVIEHDGFGAAAEELGVDQSSVSHSIAALEKVTGAPLVNRKGPLRPTELGQALLPHARTALAAARAIDSLISEHHLNKPEGIVKIAASPTAAHRMLPKLLNGWAEALPDVDVRVFEGDDDELEEWLSNGVVDCAIVIDPESTPPGGVELLTDRFQAVLRKDHPFSSQDQVGLVELLEDPLLVSSGGCEPQIRALHTASGVRYSPAQRVREISTLLSMVESNVGVAIMPSLAASMLPETLVMVNISPSLERRLVFTGPANRPWNPQVTRMLELTMASLNN